MRLYRGFSRHGKDFRSNWFNEKSVKARIPKDTAIHVHEIADKWFKVKFGIKARSETVFFTTSFDQAKEYIGNGGEVLELYEPQVRDLDYKYIFSPNVADFIEVNKEFGPNSSEEEIFNWLEKADYRCVENKDEIPKCFEGEVMLACKGYYLRKVSIC